MPRLSNGEEVSAQQLQNCVDWNIEMRDRHRAHANRVLEAWPAGAKVAEREARRHQRNIDQLNARL